MLWKEEGKKKYEKGIALLGGCTLFASEVCQWVVSHPNEPHAKNVSYTQLQNNLKNQETFLSSMPHFCHNIKITI